MSGSDQRRQAGALLDRARALRRIELDVLRRLDGSRSGDRPARQLGPGSERAGARRYAPGDDARGIDWNLSARSVELHVRETDADRDIDTWCVADRSASLDFGTARAEKRDLVLGAAAAFGLLSLRAGHRYGALACGGDALHQHPLGPGRRRLLATLAAIYDSGREQAPPAAGAELAAALQRLARVQRRRGQIVVVSDFLDRSDWATPLRRLALHHRLVAVHVSDPRELTLAPVGLLEVVDVETGRGLWVDSDDARLRERYAAAAQARHDAVATTLRHAGAAYLHLSTDRDWVRDIVRFARRRALPGRAVVMPA